MDSKDRILTAFLKELIGGKSPPDLSCSILEAWRKEQLDAANGGGDRKNLIHPVLPQAKNGHPLSDGGSNGNAGTAHTDGREPHSAEEAAGIQLRPKSEGGRPRVRMWRVLSNLAMGLTILLAGTVLGMVAVRLSNPLVQSEMAVTQQPSNLNAPPDSPANSDLQGLADTAPLPLPPAPQPEVVPDEPTQDGAAQSPSDIAIEHPRIPQSNDTIVAFINQAIQSRWKQRGVTPSPATDDSNWCRRTYQKLIGRIPSREELDRFAQDKSSDKRKALIRELLESPKHQADYLAHWSSVWTKVLMSNHADETARQGMAKYLRDALRQQKGFDQIAFELVAATGSTLPTSEEHNPAINFMLGAMKDPQGIAATRHTSRVLLGQQIACVQCHNHPTNNWNQSRFWEMNAFFRQTRVERAGQSGEVRVATVDFRPKQDEAEIYYEATNGKMWVAYPRFVDGREGSRSGRHQDVDRRQELASMIRHSNLLSQAAANRVWSLFFGVGFTIPVDDMGEHNPPSHPELLEHLSDQFAAHDFDLKKMLAWVALSDPFARSHVAGSGNMQDFPEIGAEPLFSRYYSRPLAPEDVFQSLRFVAGIRNKSGDLASQELARRLFVRQWSQTDGGPPGGVPDSLVLMTNDWMKRAVSQHQGGVLSQVLGGNISEADKIDHLFQAALWRKPKPKERQLIQEMLSRNKLNQEAVFQDIWWALLNSSEFRLDR